MKINLLLLMSIFWWHTTLTPMNNQPQPSRSAWPKGTLRAQIAAAIASPLVTDQSTLTPIHEATNITTRGSEHNLEAIASNPRTLLHMLLNSK